MTKLRRLIESAKQTNERGGSDYGSFATQVALRAKEEDYSHRGVLGALDYLMNMDFILPDKNFTDNFSQSFKFIPKSIQKFFKQLEQKVNRFYKGDNPPLVDFILKLCKDSGDSKLLNEIKELLEETHDAIWLTYSGFASPDYIENFVFVYSTDEFNNILRECKDMLNEGLKKLELVPDGGFKSNKAATINQIKQLAGETIKFASEISKLVTAQFPNGYTRLPDYHDVKDFIESEILPNLNKLTPEKITDMAIKKFPQFASTKKIILQRLKRFSSDERDLMNSIYYASANPYD